MVITSRPPPRTIRTRSRPSVSTSKNSMSVCMWAGVSGYEMRKIIIIKEKEKKFMSNINLSPFRENSNGYFKWLQNDICVCVCVFFFVLFRLQFICSFIYLVNDFPINTDETIEALPEKRALRRKAPAVHEIHDTRWSLCRHQHRTVPGTAILIRWKKCSISDGRKFFLPFYILMGSNTLLGSKKVRQPLDSS